MNCSLQTNPMPFHLESRWGATLMPLRAYTVYWRWNRRLRVDKTAVLFWAVPEPKFMKFWEDVTTPVLSNALARLSMSSFVQKIFAIKSQSRRKTIHKYKDFRPLIFSRRTTPTFLRQIVSAIYCPRFGKVWFSFVCWPPSAKLGSELECWIYGHLQSGPKIGTVFVQGKFLCCFYVIMHFPSFFDSTSAINWSRALVSERNYYVSSATLNPNHCHRHRG